MARTCRGVGVMGRVGAGPIGTQAQAWVERTCAAQGVPVHVEDRAAIGRVATLLSGAPVGSDAPQRGEPVRIEGVASADAGADHSMVEDRGDDGVLPRQGQRRPGRAQPPGSVEELVNG